MPSFGIMALRKLLVTLLISTIPTLSFCQVEGADKQKWEINLGGGFYFDKLLREDLVGSDLGMSYQLDVFHYKDNLIISPYARIMPYWSLMGEEGTSHNELGLRAGFMKPLDNSEFTMLFGASVMFGESDASKLARLTDPYGGTYEDWRRIRTDYNAVGLTTEISWKKIYRNKFTLSFAIPVTVNTWYVVCSPHAAVGIRW